MPTWSDDYLQTLQRRAEVELTTDIKCLFHRFSLEIVSGIATYTLPPGIKSIVRVTWKGRKIYPYDQVSAQSHKLYIDPLTETTTGTPYLYLQHQYGWDKLHFWPVPNESVAANDSGIWGSDIENRVIVSCWRVADPLGNTHRLPEFIRRRLTKTYVNWKAYMKEGASQDTEAAGYFREKYLAAKSHLKETMGKIPRAIVDEMQPIRGGYPKVARPRLPVQFGRIVE